MLESSKSEDWLAFLEYGLDLCLNPAPYKVLQSYETWEYRNRLRPQLYRLQRAKLLERQGAGKTQTWALTSLGKLAACGGRDPAKRWRRPWDGKWRLVMFDLPARSAQLRQKLWRWLHAQRFGFLQRSVWLSADRIDDTLLPLSQFRLGPNSFTVIEGQPAGPASDANLVQSAWDFKEINSRYQGVLDLAARGLELAERGDAKPVQVRQWLALDREAWMAALDQDPLLPEVLLPPGYLGQQALEQRRAAYVALAKHGVAQDSR